MTKIAFFFVIFLSHSLFASDLSKFNSQADQFQQILSFRERPEFLGFYHPGSDSEYQVAIGQLKSLRLSLQAELTQTTDAKEKALALGIVKRIDKKLMEFEDCQLPYWSSDVLTFIGRRLFPKLRKTLESGQKVGPTIELVKAFGSDFRDWREKLEMTVRSGKILSWNSYYLDPLKTNFLDKGLSTVIQEHFSNFDWSACMDCQDFGTAADFEALIEKEIFAPVQEVAQFIEQEVDPTAHTWSFHEPLGIQKACAQSWWQFYTEDQNLTPQALKAEALVKLKEVEALMYAQIVSLDPKAKGAKSSEEVAAEIKSHMESWVETAPKAASEVELQQHISRVYKKFELIAANFFDFELAEPNWVLNFRTDNKYIGASYFNKTKSVRVTMGPDNPLAALTSIIGHETSPGHHFQFSYINSRAPHALFKDHATTSVTEGWGVYAERLLSEQKAFDDTYEHLLNLNLLRIRLLRVINIISMNFEGQTQADLSDWYELHSLSFVLDPRFELHRAGVWRGQDLGYYVGYRRIMHLREKAKRAMGSKFDLKAFHSAILDAGHSSMQALDLQVENYIQRNIKAK